MIASREMYKDLVSPKIEFQNEEVGFQYIRNSRGII